MTATVAFDAIIDAAAALDGVAVRTPLLESAALTSATRARRVYVKCENVQHTGSFKFRGAYNAVRRLPPELRAAGVVTVSSGNHGRALAAAGRLLDLPVTVWLPADALALKADAIAALGATIRRYDRHASDGDDEARAEAEKLGATFVPTYESPDVLAGAATVALEIVEEAPDVDTILVCTGGGTLLAGTALVVQARAPRAAVIAVEPADADDFARSLESGKPVTIPPPATIADGLRATTPGRLPLSIATGLVAGAARISDGAIRRALRFAYGELKQVLEPSGAVGLAAALDGAVDCTDRTVAVILTGGNAEPSAYAGWIGPA